MNYSEESINTLDRFYQALQPDIDRLELTHASKLQCKKGCHACCIDGLEVFGIEAENIRRKFPDVLETKPHPKGKCAFLDGEGACRIYSARPYVCRTQGLPLSLKDRNGKIIRDVCPLNSEGMNLKSLPEEKVLQTTGYEDFLARLQFAVDKGEMERVRLRELFKL